MVTDGGRARSCLWREEDGEVVHWDGREQGGHTTSPPKPEIPISASLTPDTELQQTRDPHSPPKHIQGERDV